MKAVFLALSLALLLLATPASAGDCDNLPEITLNYWNGRGLMEVARDMFAMNGVFPGEGYEDARWEGGLPSVAEGEALTNPRPYQDVDKFVPVDANAGRLPILVAKQNGEEIAIGQSYAIWWYVANLFDMLGSLPHHQAQILSLLETVKELRDSYKSLVPYGKEPTQENLDLFFDGGADDYTGKANTPRRSERYLKFWTGRLENQLTGSEGFAVGDKLSLADVVIYNALAEVLEEKEAKEGLPVWRREPFADLARTKAHLATLPKLKAICDNVAANAGLQKWLTIRGVQSF